MALQRAVDSLLSRRSAADCHPRPGAQQKLPARCSVNHKSDIVPVYAVVRTAEPQLRLPRHGCRELEIGISAQQKLDKLLEVIKLLGFESLCVIGDSFDEVALLDPQSFPGAIKQFAKEVHATLTTSTSVLHNLQMACRHA